MKKTYIAAMVVLGLSLASAANAQTWTGPTQAPPSGNASSPVNVSSSAQTKIGGLILNTGNAQYGLLMPYGTAGIGTLTPNAKMQVVGGPFLSSSVDLPWKGWGSPVFSLTNPGLYVQSDSGQARTELLTVNQNGAVRAVYSGAVIGGSLQNPTATPAGSNLQVRFLGYDGSSYGNSGEMDITALQTFSYNNRPTQVTISSSGYNGNGGQYIQIQPYNIYSSTGISVYSDERLKKDITPLQGSLDDIQKLQGVSFTWKDSGKKSIGLIAQQVEKVYPDAVSTNSTTGYKAVAYESLVAPLIEAVKEQETKIDGLTAKIGALEAEIAALKTGK